MLSNHHFWQLGKFQRPQECVWSLDGVVRAKLVMLVLCASGCLAIGGCRWPDVIVKQRASGTVYDTANEEKALADDLPPLLKSWRDDALPYSEPVAICGWQDGVSTWKIHYATNRALESMTASRGRYGNGLQSTVNYGVAEVTIPRRRRGIDIPLNSRKSQWAAENGQTEPEVVSSVMPCGQADFLAGVCAQVMQSRQQDLLLFVHGFNVSFDAAIVRTAQIALDMPFNGAVVAYGWPSQGGVQNYGRDEPVNAQSVQPFREFLVDLRRQIPSETRLHIMVHSMGNRIVLAALAGWPDAEMTVAESPPISQLVLMAPDVGRSDFLRWWPAVSRCCEQVTLYASDHDAALTASKSLHAEVRIGNCSPPVVLDGLETIDCSAVDLTSFLGHSYYSSNVDVLADVFILLKRQKTASQRAHLKSRKSPDGEYWSWTENAPRDIWTWHFDHLVPATPVAIGTEESSPR